MKSGLAIATPEHSECFSINMFILYSMTDLIALVNVKARFFKNSSEVLAGRFVRNVANENLDGLPGDNVHGQLVTQVKINLLFSIISNLITHVLESSTLSRFPL